MNRMAIGVIVLGVLAACERRTDTKAAQASVQVSSSSKLDERLLTGLEARRQWSSSGVKIHLKGPTVEVSVADGDGKTVMVHAWASNENDFNVAVMRLDGGPVLYAITDEEWLELRRR